LDVGRAEVLVLTQEVVTMSSLINHRQLKRDLHHGHQPMVTVLKYRYRYYPDCSVYYDTGRKLYFYIEANNWAVSVSLPEHLSAKLVSGYVNLKMDTDKPYTDYSDHKKKYPPGQTKKTKLNKWADKGNK
jgi:hypothetical protein